MPDAPASKLINDLSHVPEIVGGLGLSIAAAQKAFNADYMNNIERILAMAFMMLGGKKADPNGGATPIDLTDAEMARLKEFSELFKQLLVVAAPPRYQYTETTLNVKLDLAQSLDVSASVGLGLGFGAVAVNASLTLGFSYDYRAAAEVRTIINAIPADAAVMNTLLSRADKLSDKVLTLPDRSQVDQNIIDKNAEIFGKLIGANPAKPPVKA